MDALFLDQKQISDPMLKNQPFSKILLYKNQTLWTLEGRLNQTEADRALIFIQPLAGLSPDGHPFKY